MGLTPSALAGAGHSKSAMSPSSARSRSPTPSRTTVPALTLPTPRSHSSTSLEPPSARTPTEACDAHPTSPRAGGKLDLIKRTILEDPSVLKDAQWCAAFIRYLKEAYPADLLGDDHEPHRVKLAKKLQVTARVFFNFWADLTDLEWCHAPSEFRSLRLETILEKYLSRGAETPVPLSESVRSSLLGDDGSGNATQESLNDATEEAFRYLSSEVLPYFVGSKSPLGLSACLYKTKRIVWTLDDAEKKLNAYPETMNIMVRVASSQAFHSFMKSKDEMLGHMVMAAVEIQGYKSMTDHWGLQRWRQKHAKGKADSESQANEQAPQENGPAPPEALFQARFEIITAHDIFDTHFRLGQPVRALLPSTVMQTLLSSASDPALIMTGGGALPLNLYDELLVYLLYYLNEHLADFYKSREYAALKQPKDGKDEISKEMLEQRREELGMMLRSLSLKAAFQRYLESMEDPQAIWVLRFHQEVLDLQTCGTEVPLTVFGRVIKIFLMYIRRGGPCELVVLSGAPRIRVIEKLIRPGALSDTHVYDVPQALAFDALATQWLPGFSLAAWLTVEVEEMMASPLPGEPSTQPAAGTALRLSAVLESSSAFAALRSFAASEYLSHPVQFWLEAENYRTLPRADLLLARARTIINKYIAPGASRAVPLSEPVRERILAACYSELVGPGLFMEAQMQVYQWMESELMPRFVKAPEYQARLARLKASSKSKSVKPGSARGSGSEGLVMASAAGSSTKRLSERSQHSSRRGSMETEALPSARQGTADDLVAVIQLSEHMDNTKLMSRLLEVPIGRQFFTDYCKERGVYKHLAFWLDAEDFSKHLPGHHAFRNSQARKLISKYIADDAHMKVPINYTTQRDLLHHLSSPSSSLFKTAQDEVLAYMANDLLPDFLESEGLRNMVKAEAITKTTPWSRLSRRVSSMLRKGSTSNNLHDSSNGSGRQRKANSHDSVASAFSSSSSSLNEAFGSSTRELWDSANWSQKFSASFRAMIGSSTGKKKSGRRSGSEEPSGALDYHPHSGRLRHPQSQGSHSSGGDSSSQSSRSSKSSFSGMDDSVAEVVLQTLHDALDAGLESGNPSARVDVSARGSPTSLWRPPSRGVQVVPFNESYAETGSSGSGDDGRKDGTF